MSDFKEFCRSQPLIYCREISCSLCKRNREATTKLQSKIEELEAKLKVCEEGVEEIQEFCRVTNNDDVHLAGCMAHFCIEKIKAMK